MSSRRQAGASQPSPGKSKAGTAAEGTDGSSLDTISSAKRPLPDEGTAVLDEPSSSRMRPASTATTAAETPGKRKSTHQALPEGDAHGGEDPAPPNVPASKYAHGTLRPGADGKSQWKAEEQPGGGACRWQRVAAAKPRGARRPPPLAAKRPPDVEAPGGVVDVPPAPFSTLTQAAVAQAAAAQAAAAQAAAAQAAQEAATARPAAAQAAQESAAARAAEAADAPTSTPAPPPAAPA